MNKIYRVIWNKVRNCYVVVSEIAKRNSKGSAVTDCRRRFSSVLAAMVLASLLNLGVAAPVWAEDPVPPATGANYYGVNATETTSSNKNGEGATGDNAIAAGVNAKAAGDNAIAIGNGAKAKESDSIAIGTGATAKGVGSIALGRKGATAVGWDAMAWGVNTKAKGDESTAWGTKTKAKGDGSTAGA